MCAATIYWANIGRVVYGASNEALDELVGENGENLTMRWSCRDIFNGGKKDVQVLGPIHGVEREVVELSRPYWQGQKM
jgi:tRNA(Arg) A34 adenosine deaminase TadA